MTVVASPASNFSLSSASYGRPVQVAPVSYGESDATRSEDCNDEAVALALAENLLATAERNLDETQVAYDANPTEENIAALALAEVEHGTAVNQYNQARQNYRDGALENAVSILEHAESAMASLARG